jgi:hypothetical protein
LLKDKVISHSKSPWSAPVVLVEKPGTNKLRFTVDFRKLNQRVVKDCWPLPQIRESVESVKGASFFSSADLMDGFHQIPLDASVQELTGFSTPSGHFHYLRLPQGFKNSSSIFQRSMQMALSDVPNLLVYIDDLLIWSGTFDSHLQHLEVLLRKLDEINFSLKLSKCSFAVGEVEYLGHRISAEGVQPSPRKLRAIASYSPVTKKDLVSLTAACNFYRKFIPRFSQRFSQILDWIRLTKSDEARIPGSLSHAVEELKGSMNNLLVYPDFSKEFVLRTDASDTAVGAVLEQDSKPVGYFSQLLNCDQRRWHISEKEAYAIKSAIDHFRYYLTGASFLVFTDHENLVKFFRDHQGLKTHKSRRINGWFLELSSYDFRVVHIPGTDNPVADFLSRPLRLCDHVNVIQQAEEHEETPDAMDIDDPILEPSSSLDRNTITISASEIKNAQRDDPYLSKVIQLLLARPSFLPANSPSYQDLKRFVFQDNILYRISSNRLLVAVPQKLENKIFFMFHDDILSGHRGKNGMIKTIMTRFWIPCIQKKCREYCNSCLHCRAAKSRLPRPFPLQPFLTSIPWHTVSIDIFGGLPASLSGHKKVLSVICNFTGFVSFIPLLNETAEQVTFRIYDLFCLLGFPKRLISDNGGPFVSKIFQLMLEKFNVKGIKSSPYHPQGNGKVERIQRSLKYALQIFSRGRPSSWSDHLSAIAFALNTTSKGDYSPFSLLLGREPNLPSASDLFETLTAAPFIRKAQSVARHVQELEKRLQKHYYDQKNKAKAETYKEGELVLLLRPVTAASLQGTSRKLLTRFTGPYVVMKINPSGTNYDIEHWFTKKRYSRVHFNRLLRYEPYSEGLRTSTRGNSGYILPLDEILIVDSAVLDGGWSRSSERGNVNLPTNISSTDPTSRFTTD